VVAAVTVLAVGVAEARSDHFESKVKVQGFQAGCKRGCQTAVGKVRSSHQTCEHKRTVKVFLKQDPGTYHWKGTTDSSGHWAIAVNYLPADAEYYAKVKKRVLGSGAVCKGDRSEDVTPSS
jgi:hypothetical protein